MHLSRVTGDYLYTLGLIWIQPKLLSSIPFLSAGNVLPISLLPTAPRTAFSNPSRSPSAMVAIASLNAVGSLCASPSSVDVASECRGLGWGESGGSSSRHSVGSSIDIALGLDSVGKEGDVAYATRALTISFISSIDVAGREVVADSTTRAETWPMRGERRCRARCCKIGDGAGAEFVDDGRARRLADSRVDVQWTAVKPSCQSAPEPIWIPC